VVHGEDERKLRLIDQEYDEVAERETAVREEYAYRKHQLEQRRQERLKQRATAGEFDDTGLRTAALRVTGLYDSARAERIAIARGDELKYHGAMTIQDLEFNKIRRERAFDRAQEIDRERR